MAARIQALGDSAITIELGAERSPELLREVHAAAAQIRLAGLDEIEDVVPAYLALSVFYNPLRSSFSDITKRVLEILSAREFASSAADPVHHVIPVRYDGVDLENVAVATKLTPAQVIDLHSARTYTVDLLGFVPGWAYLSELDTRLQIPRRPQPRPRVAGGSVAIAATQTGVYPLDTPGGWHIIGNTDVALFDPSRDPPALLKAGDTVRFERSM